LSADGTPYYNDPVRGSRERFSGRFLVLSTLLLPL